MGTPKIIIKAVVIQKANHVRNSSIPCFCTMKLAEMKMAKPTPALMNVLWRAYTLSASSEHLTIWIKSL